jgi:hypothetical protein
MQRAQSNGRPPVDNSRRKLTKGLSIGDDDPFRAVFMAKAVAPGSRKAASASQEVRTQARSTDERQMVPRRTVPEESPPESGSSDSGADKEQRQQPQPGATKAVDALVETDSDDGEQTPQSDS